MASTDPKPLIEQATRNFLDEVTALQQLKLVVGLELVGRGDRQTFRVEVPGPIVTKEVPDDAKIWMAVPRSFFNVLAKDGKVADWRESFEHGHAKASGSGQIQKLIEKVVERHEERERLRRASKPTGTS